MKIKYRPMSELPFKSCDVILCSKWFELRITPYSAKYNKFGVRDSYTEEEAAELAADKSLYIGWAYAAELVWQMVVEYEAV
jgi:hypothetical protein